MILGFVGFSTGLVPRLCEGSRLSHGFHKDSTSFRSRGSGVRLQAEGPDTEALMYKPENLRLRPFRGCSKAPSRPGPNPPSLTQNSHNPVLQSPIVP